MGSRVGRLAPSAVDRVEVWRASDGERRYRLLGPGDRTLAVLLDSRWAVPGGRMTMCLESVGWSVETVDASDVTHPLDSETVVGRGGGAGLAGVVGVVLVLVSVLIGIGATVSGSDLPGAPPVLSAVSAWAGLLGGAALLQQWAATNRAAPRLPVGAVRPGAGPREAWRQRAGTASIQGRVVLWDGWGRLRVLPASGVGAPVAVASAPGAAVLVDAGGKAVLRFPLDAWGGPVAELATAVGAATALPVVATATDGGEEVVDPEPGPIGLPVLACALVALAALPALVAGLFTDNAWGPHEAAWMPAALTVTGSVVVAVVSAWSAQRRGRGRSASATSAPDAPSTFLAWFPTAAGVVLLASPITYVAALPREALSVWLGALTLTALGCAGVAVRQSSVGAQTAAAAVVPVMTLILLAGLRSVIDGQFAVSVLVLAGGSAVICLAAVVGAARGARSGRR